MPAVHSNKYSTDNMPMLSRRSFIKTSLIGTAALALAGGLYRLTQSTPAVRFRLDRAATAALAAIVPAMLREALPKSPATAAGAAAAAIARVQIAIDSLPLRTQKEIADLFGLLTLAPARRWLVGISEDWPNADTKDVAIFLQNWRTHRLGLLQSAYQALHDLILGAWYSDAATWPAIGYPGPITLP